MEAYRSGLTADEVVNYLVTYNYVIEEVARCLVEFAYHVGEAVCDKIVVTFSGSYSVEII